MRIAQVSPLFERVPPGGYGGTERVVSYLTEELVRRGHQVTLFATADSITSARLVPGAPAALRPAGRDRFAHIYHVAMLDEVYARADEFDVVHAHVDCLHFPLALRSPVPWLTTIHGRLDLEDIVACYRRFAALPFVSISNDQRRPMPWLHWRATVHHGLPRTLHSPVRRPGDYLAFLGRMSPEKGFEDAVEIARRTGLPLRAAGKLDPSDEVYWRRRVLPFFDSGEVEYVGEIGGRVKDEFLGGARALLFPIDWPEPFGLVMIEAFACGTPVIGYRRGSVPEVIEDGLTGFIVDRVDEAVRAVAHVGRLDRGRIRARFEERFSVERMTDDYLRLYHELGATHGRTHQRAGGATRRAAGPTYRARRA